MSGAPIRRERDPGYVRSEGETGASYVRRMVSFLEHIENQSGVHTTWYTHRNSAGCWICDGLLLGRRAVEELRRLYEIEEEYINNEANPKDS